MDEERTLSGARERFLLTAERKGCRPATLDVYRLYTREYMEYIAQCRLPDTMASLNVDVAEDWLASRPVRGKRGGIVATHQAATVAKTWSAWLWKRRWLEHDPLAILEKPQYDQEPRQPFTEDEVRRILAAAQAGKAAVMHRALLLLMLTTGCRIGELLQAEVRDLDMEQGVILFRFTKGRKPRAVLFVNPEVPGGGRCVEATRAYVLARKAQPEVERLFLDAEGLPLGYVEVYERFKVWGRAADVDPCTPHLTRHTAASHFMMERPGAREELRDRVGHMDDRTLEGYVHVMTPGARNAATVASLADRWEL